MDTKTILSEASDRMQKTIEHLEEELLNIRAGKASPTVLNGVFVDYYGSQTPISGVASVTVPDAKTILIQPWDKNLIRAIEKAIIDSNMVDYFVKEGLDLGVGVLVPVGAKMTDMKKEIKDVLLRRIKV